MASIRARIHKLPDPTHFFLFQVAVILALHSYKPEFLSTWIARLTLAPALVISVLTAAIWRRPTASTTSGNSGKGGLPLGVVPDAHALVKRGKFLRKRDAEVARSEADVRKGQLRLEMLRKEIESRLPNSNNSNTTTSAVPHSMNTASTIASRINSTPVVATQKSAQAFGTAAGGRASLPLGSTMENNTSTVDAIRAQI